MQTWVLRFAPGTDLVGALDDARRDNGWTAAFVVSGVGSLQSAALRYADASDPVELAGPLELVSLSGTLSLDGPHLHGAVSDAQGRVSGGHLKSGAKVRTTAEVLVAVLPDVVFRRRPDPRTGYAELDITPRVQPPG
jgi:predicted DNA-binding protein with PD1-like motif